MTEIHFVKLPRKSNEVFIRVFTNAGRDSENRDNQGIGHLLDHYINGGIFQKHYNLDTNAYIDRDFLWFSLNTTKKKLFKQLENFLLYVTKPDFTQEELLSFEKQALINEMKSSEAVLYNKLFQGVLTKTLAHYSSVYREIENVPRFQLDELAQYHRGIINRGPVTVIVGYNGLSKKDRHHISSLVSSNFPDNSKSVIPSFVTVGPRIESVEELPSDAKGQVLIYLAMKTFGYCDEKEKRIAVNLALRELRGHSKHSPFLLLRKLGVYSLDYNHWIGLSYGQAVISIVCMPHVVDEATNILMSSLKHLSEMGLSKAVIEKHKRRNSEYFKQIQQNNGEYFSNALDDILYEGKELNYKEHMISFKNITPEMTRRIYSEIFAPRNLSKIIYK